MQSTMKYNLQYFTNISFNGFDFVVPEDVVNLISSLSMEVGSPSYIRTPIFKKNIDQNTFVGNNGYTNGNGNNNSRPFQKNEFNNFSNKRRRGNKGMEMSDAEWDSIRSFQPTKIEKKTGIDAHIDQIRLMLNKLTDKTYPDISSQIAEIINTLVSDETAEEDMIKIGNFIFDSASTNKFYSKIYADLYANLIQKYDFLTSIFEKNYASYMELFHKIESGDPDKDYDRFCEINKINEKRKAISMFFVNLNKNNVVSTSSIVEILRDLLVTVLSFIEQDNKKNEVDEITENIAILYRKELVEQIGSNESDSDAFMVNGLTITETIKKLAKSKSKDYKSLSNKSVFKYMDLVEM